MTAKFREISGLYHDNGELASAGSPFFMPTGGLDRAPRAFGAGVAPAAEVLGGPCVLPGSTQVTVRNDFGSRNLDSVQKPGERLLADVERSAERL